MNVGRGELLVVDDVTSDRETIVGLLEGSGYSVRISATEGHCLRQVSDYRPALVIFNLGNPLVDSIQLIAQVVGVSATTRIIVVAPYDRADMLTGALKAGAVDYLMLPLVDEDLLELLVERNLRVPVEQGSNPELANLNRKLGDSLKILERDQRAGFRVQRGMMPRSPQQVGGVTLTHHVIPSLILSGDFIDFFELPDRTLLFYIADVSGHGASSAFVTVLLKSLSRNLARDFERYGLADTGAILRWFNRELLESELDKHVTMFLGIVDVAHGTLQYSNAAHFPATIFNAAEKTEFLEIGGLPLGLYESPNYETKNKAIPGEFTLVMFSDGIFEVMAQQTLKAKEEFLLYLVEEGHKSVDQLADNLGLDGITDVPDDIALFTVSRAS